MYKLLIIDDEKQIRDGLKNMLQWENYGFEICGEAANGREGLEMVKLHNPELVITDIEMPYMDGLALMESLKSFEKRPIVVVLSGYDDFGLVRKAMRSGAVDYLLKSSGIEEFVRVLEEVITILDKEEKSLLELQENTKLMKDSMLNRLVHNEISFSELRMKLELLDYRIPKGECCIAVIQLKKTFKTDEAENDENLIQIKQRITNFCENIVGDAGYVFTDEGGRICILFEQFNGNDAREYWKKNLKRVIEYVAEEEKSSVSIAMGGNSYTYRSVCKSYNEALTILEYRFVFGYDCVLCHTEINKFLSRDKLSLVDGNIFKNLIKQENYEKIEEYINEIFNIYNEKKMLVAPYILRNYAFELIVFAYECFDTMSYIEKSSLLKMKAEMMDNIHSVQTLDDLQRMLKNNVLHILEEIRKKRRDSYSKIVADCIQYVRKEYGNMDLSLALLAEEFHVNPAYLGRIFRKETSVSFNEYLNNVRVEKAKELLVSTNYKGNELCKELGFSSYNYFYMVFKKFTGMNPIEYRNQ